MTCISAIKSPIVLKMVSSGGYGNIIPSCKPNVIANYRQDVEKQSENDKLYVRSINTTQDIDTLYNDIRLVLLSSSKNHLPYRKGFKQFLKKLRVRLGTCKTGLSPPVTLCY